MPFPRAFVQSETHTAAYRIWTRIADSISNDDIHYAKNASIIIIISSSSSSNSII